MIAVSSLLAVMDDFVFNHFDQEGNLVMRNIGKDVASPPSLCTSPYKKESSHIILTTITTITTTTSVFSW